MKPTPLFIDAVRLREVLNYDPDTGVFTWRVSTSNRAPVGSVAGWNTDGHIGIAIDGVKYKAHRLAWVYMTGEQPQFEIDHINGMRDDNRWTNLRDVPAIFNCQNQRRAQPKNKSCGLLGVCRDKRTGRWYSQICANNKVHHLGSFPTAEEAHQAYVEAKRKLHPGCTI